MVEPTKSQPLRVLLVEDDPNDALLVVRALKSSRRAIEWRQVETAEAMQSALEMQRWDLIISDYSLPRFSAPAALEIARRTGTDTPFIIVSGTIGEAKAVAALKAGAHDVLSKQDLARLVPAVERELREADNRRHRREAETALRSSEERYRLLFERNLAGVYRATTGGALLDCNDAFARIYGFTTREEALTRTATELYSDPAVRNDLIEALRLAGHVINFESQGRRRDGDTVWVLENASLVNNEAGEPTIIEGTVVDVTDRRRAEEALQDQQLQLIHAQKMEAVGRLAGGVAHDFNNLLQAMLSVVQVLRVGGSRTDPAARLEELETHVRRGAQLVRQLLLFSRADRPQPRCLDLNELLHDSAGLLRRLMHADIAIQLDLGESPLRVEADPGQIEQVIVNLAVNAADAMPEGGSITLQTGRDDETVWFAISDTGHGIPDSVRSHLFEPFFTTKPAGRGTGLGLSVVQGIVTRHGGTIEVDSHEGKGTTFRITLPRRSSGEYAPLREATLADVPSGAGERVLVVEDEDGARAGMAEILGLLGYDVVALASGEEAEAWSPASPFALLITDLMLPGVSGAELAAKLQRRWPRLAVVLMSGYAVEEVLRHPDASQRMQFLQKPFDMATLARAVRAALAAV